MTVDPAELLAGPAREGIALLQGLGICGRCERRMTVRYHTRRGIEFPDYQCQNPSSRTEGNAAKPCPVAPSTPTRCAAGTSNAPATAPTPTAAATWPSPPTTRLVAASREADWNDALRALQTAREDDQRASEAAAAS